MLSAPVLQTSRMCSWRQQCCSCSSVVLPGVILLPASCTAQDVLNKLATNLRKCIGPCLSPAFLVRRRRRPSAGYARSTSADTGHAAGDAGSNADAGASAACHLQQQHRTREQWPCPAGQLSASAHRVRGPGACELSISEAFITATPSCEAALEHV